MVYDGSDVTKAYYNGKVAYVKYVSSVTPPGPPESENIVTVDLNSQWQESTSYGSLDPSQYNFYESFSNYHIADSMASLIIDVEGFDTFSFYVRDYSGFESNWDFLVVNNIDDLTLPSRWQTNWTEGKGLALDRYCKYTNIGKGSQTQWYEVTFNDIPAGSHKIMVTYGKDAGGDDEDDKGYVAIAKTYFCESETRWVEDGTMCYEGDLVKAIYEEIKCINDTVWKRTGKAIPGDIVEKGAAECEARGKLFIEDENGNQNYIECTQDGFLSQEEYVTLSNTFTSSTELNVTVGDCVEEIEDYCFRNQNANSKVVSFKISEGVKTIGHEAFMDGFNKLTTLTIPSTVTKIGFWAFTRMGGLQEAIILPTTPPERTGNMDGLFHDYQPPVIYVPDESIDLYKTATDWKNYASLYKPLSEYVPNEWVGQPGTNWWE